MKPMNNIFIDQSKNEVNIKVNTTFYPKEHIYRTVEKFESLFSIEITEQTDNSMLICLKPKNEAESYIGFAGLEFMNHLLEEIKCNDVL